MKKFLSFLLIMMLLLCSAGCKKDQSRLEAGTPLSFESMKQRENNTLWEFNIYHTLSQMMKDYSLEDTIVFQGVKEGLTTPVIEYGKDGTPVERYHCETKLRASKVFYGDLQPGDFVICKEQILVTDTYYSCMFNEAPIEDGEEYIFILEWSGEKAMGEGELYIGHPYHFKHKISDHSRIKEKIQQNKGSWSEKITAEVLDYYLSDPDTSIDLRAEIMKETDQWLDLNGTKEEWLQALPKEKRPFYERMIAQYGIK